MFDELIQLDKNKVIYTDRLFLSDRAHLVTEMHLFADSRAETDPKSEFFIIKINKSSFLYYREIPWNYKTRYWSNIFY